MITRSAGLAFAVATAVAVAAVIWVWRTGGPTPDQVVIVGSTTTTQDTGLLDVLQDEYRRVSGVPLRIVVASTGAILEQGKNGDLDVLLTHDRQREVAFVAEGHGLWRQPVMYNLFVLVGPGLRTWDSPLTEGQLATNSTAFLSLLYEHRNEITFVSRGDGSGTHARELQLWRLAGVDPERLVGPWYKETGSGQAETIRVAAEFGAYALVDEGTWNRLNAQGLTGNLEVVVSDPARMKNQYGVIPISASRHPRANQDGGIAFAEWLVGPGGQAIIAAYEVAGRPAFDPNADEPGA